MTVFIINSVMRVFFLRLETGLSLIYVVVHIWVNMCISWVIWVRIKCVFISLSRNYVSVSVRDVGPL